MTWSELYDEIYKSLSLYCISQLLPNIKLTKLDSPLDQSPCSFQLVHCFFERMIYHNVDDVNLEVMPQLLGSRYQCKSQYCPSIPLRA